MQTRSIGWRGGLKWLGQFALLVAIVGFATSVKAATTVVLPAGSANWEFFNDTTRRPANDVNCLPWYEPNYTKVPSEWTTQTGTAPYANTLNALNGIGRALIPPIPAGTQPTAIYFRKTFTRTAMTPRTVSIRAMRDDGIVIYLNGIEIARQNMPATPASYEPSHATLAPSLVDGANESTFFTTAATSVTLANGVNTVAVEVHNQATTSSDIGFDLEISETDNPPAPSITREPYLQLGTPTSMVVRWRTSAAVRSYIKIRRPTSGGTNYSTVSYYGSVLATDHEWNLVSLVPGAQYLYEIGYTNNAGTAFKQKGDVGIQDQEYSFFTSPKGGTDRNTRIWVLGDSGDTTGSISVRNAFKAFNNNNSRVDLWMMLGDNAYNNGTDGQYQSYLFDVF